MPKIPRLVRWLFCLAFFFLALMSTLRLGTYWTFKPDESSFGNTLPAFWLGFRYDARIVAIIILTMLIFGSFRPLDPFHSNAGKKAWLFFLMLVSIFFILFYVFDYLNFRYLSQRLNASALSFLEDAKISAGMIWQTYPVFKILIGIIITSILLARLLKKLYLHIGRKSTVATKSLRIRWFLIAFLVCAFAIFGRLGRNPLRWSDAFNLGSDFKANLALNPFQSFFSSLRVHPSSYDKKKVAKYYPLMAAYLGVDKPDPSHLNFERLIAPRDSSPSSRPNIVLVICESFSAYKSSMWGNPLNTTPYFNELCKKGVFFDNCFTPHFGTARGVWATLTGIPDVEVVKTASRNPAMVDQHTILNAFDGYRKLYFLGGNATWANIRGLLANNIPGLQLYEEQHYGVPKIDVWGISDKNLFLEANKILSTQPTPFFAIIQTADNHRPYTIPAEDLKEFSKIELPSDSLRKYGFQSNEELNAFRYADFGYRKFMEAAARSDYFENTIFAFVGDHGIGGDAGSMFPHSWTDNGLTAYHVPLLFYSPKYLKPQRLHHVASQVDVLPTIAGLANIGYTNNTFGKDLMADTLPGKDHIAFIIDHNNNDIGVLKGNYYYSREPSGEKEDLVWADFARDDPGEALDTIKAKYRDYTIAFSETAKYLLLHNKKKAARRQAFVTP